MEPNPKQNKAFMHRLNYYWQSIAIYAVALVLYTIVKGTMQEGSFSITITDPLFLLLCAFVVGSAIGLLFALYMRRSVIIGSDFITFRNRYTEKTLALSEIKKIRLARERRDETGVYRIISINTKNRRRPYRLRPAGFDNEKEMISEILRLKKSLPSR